MKQDDAIRVLGPLVCMNGDLDWEKGIEWPWVGYYAGRAEISLDGDFTLERLEAIVWWMKRYSPKVGA